MVDLDISSMVSILSDMDNLPSTKSAKLQAVADRVNSIEFSRYHDLDAVSTSLVHRCDNVWKLHRPPRTKLRLANNNIKRMTDTVVGQTSTVLDYLTKLAELLKEDE